LESAPEELVIGESCRSGQEEAVPEDGGLVDPVANPLLLRKSGSAGK
jgi:hypothetical protein